jgi:hypothetical protein
MSAPIRNVKCPQCGTAVPWLAASRWRPFCSERCRTLDAAAWASERYRMPADDASGAADPAADPDPEHKS